MRSKPLSFLLAATLILCGCAANRADVTSSDLPGPVQSTLEHEAQGGKVNKVIKETTTAGITYKADVSATNGQRWDVVIDGAGKLIYKHVK